jgi:acyl-CoA synthetase (AMP-forming)/AMP-acid ligase II
MHWLIERLKSFGPRTACIEPGKAWSYDELLAKIEAVKSAPGAGRVVPIDTGRTVDGLATLVAIADSDRIVLPLPTELSKGEREHIRQVTSDSPLYDQLPGSGLILFSSGTSGAPKAMLHSLTALLNRFEPVAARDDRTLQLLLIDHIGGLDAAFRCLCAGSTLIIPEARTPEAAARAIQEYRVNVLPASPTFLNLMLLNRVNQLYDCSSVRVIAYGAEAMPPPLLKGLAEAFPEADLQQKFGTSETGAIRIQSRGKDSLFFRIKDPGTEWKIIDGELWLKSPSRIIGYLNADESSLEADGWYRTGDLVETAADGSLRIIGRESATINIGGLKVHPSEVEAVLSEIDGIDACRVFAETDPITGQRVACEIVSQTSQDLRAWKRTIRRHCREKLAPWKIPASLTVRNELSLNKRLKRDCSH